MFFLRLARRAARLKAGLVAALLLVGACAGEGPDEADATAPSGDAPARAQRVEADAAEVGPAVDGPGPNVGGSGGASSRAIFYDDPQLRCYKLRAFAAATSKDTSYGVPTAPSTYVTFTMRAPWPGLQYVKSFRSLLDNAPLLQHWLLYRQLNGGTEGVNPNGRGLHPDGETLYGWAPGGNDLWFDRDVGVEVPPNAVLQLEVHYDNRTGAVAPDASGVEVCVTPKKPAVLAGLSWLGTDLINGASARGTCTPANTAPIRLFASQAHMHAKGTHMTVALLRASGETALIYDQPFRFDAQTTAFHDLAIQPGDRLITTCSYAAPVRFGRTVNDETCYFFALHAPGGTLARRSLASFIHGPSTCID